MLSLILATPSFATSSLHWAAEGILYGDGELSSPRIKQILNELKTKEQQTKVIKLPTKTREEIDTIISTTRASLQKKIDYIKHPDLTYLIPRVKELLDFQPDDKDTSNLLYLALLEEVDREMGPQD